MTVNWAPQKQSRRIVTAGSSVAAHKLAFVLELSFTQPEDLNRQIISQAPGQGAMLYRAFVFCWWAKSKWVWTPLFFPVAEDFITYLSTVIPLEFS